MRVILAISLQSDGALNREETPSISISGGRGFIVQEELARALSLSLSFSLLSRLPAIATTNLMRACFCALVGGLEGPHLLPFLNCYSEIKIVA